MPGAILVDEKKPNEVVATLAVTVGFNKVSTIKRLNESPGLTLRGFLVSLTTHYLVS